MNKQLEYKSKWGTMEKVEIQIGAYADNAAIFLELIGVAGEYKEPYGNITVNLDGSLPEYYGYVDTNNMPEMEGFIKENGLGYPMGINRRSGFCTYPLYVFNRDKLMELCPDGVLHYEAELNKRFPQRLNMDERGMSR